jgi:hypothetical protein
MLSRHHVVLARHDASGTRVAIKYLRGEPLVAGARVSRARSVR